MQQFTVVGCMSGLRSQTALQLREGKPPPAAEEVMSTTTAMGAMWAGRLVE